MRFSGRRPHLEAPLRRENLPVLPIRGVGQLHRHRQQRLRLSLPQGHHRDHLQQHQLLPPKALKDTRIKAPNRPC